MHSDNAQHRTAQPQLDASSTARLHGGQVDRMRGAQVDATSDQQGIAMPADAFRHHAKFRDLPVVFFQRLAWQRRRARTEAAVAFLQGHYVGIEFMKDSEDPRRIAAAVQPYRLADIVACKGKLKPALIAPWWR